MLDFRHIAVRVGVWKIADGGTVEVGGVTGGGGGVESLLSGEGTGGEGDCVFVGTDSETNSSLLPNFSSFCAGLIVF